MSLTVKLIPLALFAAFCSCERVLFLAPVCSKSHKFSFMPIAEALAERGHQVTVVTPYKSSKPIENLREIVVQDVLHGIEMDWFALQKKNPVGAMATMLSAFRQMMTIGFDRLMSNEEFVPILKDRAADLIIVDAVLNDFTLPIIESFQVPFIFYLPASSVPWTTAAMSIPAEYASVPAGMGDFTSNNMNFFQRMSNMIGSELFLMVRKHFLLRMIDGLVKKDFPNARPVEQIELDASMMFVNSHPATAWPRPLPPNVIPIGALHVRPAKALPQDLQKFADDALDGLIVFTLGSAIPVASMPQYALDAFVKAFAKLPQRVIWKWENTQMDGVSSNVLLIDWLPQQDLLAHPNTRLFISHGGLLGFQEALYHAVPLLGLPIGNDQRSNIAKAVNEGFGQLLNWEDINEESLSQAITTMIASPSYHDNATRLSKLIRDEMMPAKDVAVYWVEHVLRHGGTKHLQSSSKNLPLYQYFLIDVFLFLAAVAAAITAVSIALIRCLWRYFAKPAKIKVN